MDKCLITLTQKLPMFLISTQKIRTALSTQKGKMAHLSSVLTKLTSPSLHTRYGTCWKKQEGITEKPEGRALWGRGKDGGS